MKNRILITGDSGLVGGKLAKSLASKYDIVGISKRAGYDITLGDSMTALEGSFDIIIHCAASFLDDTIDSMLQNELVNSIGTLNICKLAAERHCRHFIYISSISSLNDYKSDLNNSYGISKRHGEDNVRLFCKHNRIKYTILRFSQIYDDEKKAIKHQQMLYRLIDLIAEDQEVVIYGVNNPLRNYIHIDDVVEVIKRVVALNLEGEYYCVHPKSERILRIIRTIGHVMKKEPIVRLDLGKENIKDIFLPEKLSLYKMIDYYPAVDLNEGIKRIVTACYEKV
jgi:nucleoside-diphosphate-sugar epimerase